MYECPKCKHSFNDQAVYCENWRDNDKCFGCPNCRQFFYKVSVGKPDLRQYLLAFFGSALAFILLVVLLPEIELKKFLLPIVPMVIFSVVAVKANRKIKSELKPVDETSEA